MAPLAKIFADFDWLKEKYGYVASPDIEKRIRDDWLEQGAQRLGGLRGYVAIRADYKIDGNPQDRAVTFRVSVGSPTCVSVVAECSDDGMRRGGRTAVLRRPRVEVTCVGRVLPGDSGDNELLLVPIAIFLTAMVRIGL
jgi:hypothetical protein